MSRTWRTVDDGPFDPAIFDQITFDVDSERGEWGSGSSGSWGTRSTSTWGNPSSGNWNDPGNDGQWN